MNDFLVSVVSFLTWIIFSERSFFKHLNNVALGCLQFLIIFSRLINLFFSWRNKTHKNMSRSVKDNLSSPNSFSWSLNRDYNFAKDRAFFLHTISPIIIYDIVSDDNFNFLANYLNRILIIKLFLIYISSYKWLRFSKLSWK